MAKFIADMKCPDRFCRGNFKIEVDEKYSKQKMKMECPKCLGPFIGRIPEAPKKEEGIISDVFRTGEEFVTGAHEVVKDLLGKLNREI